VKINEGNHRVWLFGHFGQTNFGNESTLQAFLFHINRVLPHAQITCVCTGPLATAEAYGIATLPISRTFVDYWTPETYAGRIFRSLLFGFPCEVYRWLDGLRTLRPGDVFIIPGTGLISDAYGLRGWGPYNLFKWSLVARIRGCKILFVSVGAGPLYGRLGRFFAKSALALADYRSYRDAASLQYLVSIGAKVSEDAVYPDLAWGLPRRHIGGIGERSQARATARRVVGVGVMLYAGKYSIENPDDKVFRNYLDKLIALVRSLLGRDYDVRLLIGDLCDEPVVEQFKRLLQGQLPGCEHRILHDQATTVDELLDQIAETQFVVVTRFHNVLLALASEKPVIAISFHHKVASLMETMGLSEYCLDINNLHEDELISRSFQLECNVENLIGQIRGRSEACRAALEEQYERIVNEIER
jgi:polysaccharide pyruvyl transferase WcaK-like protein